jgi:hypothetical protein
MDFDLNLSGGYGCIHTGKTVVIISIVFKEDLRIDVTRSRPSECVNGSGRNFIKSLNPIADLIEGMIDEKGAGPVLIAGEKDYVFDVVLSNELKDT